MRSWRRPLIAVAVVGLLAIVSGAFVTSSNVTLQPGQPKTGSDAHRMIALVSIAAGLAVCVLISFRRTSPLLRIAVWSAFSALAISGAIGWRVPLSPAAAVWHASFAHLFMACIAGALLFSAPQAKDAIPLFAEQWRLLQPAARVTPAVVLAQILMGALYRHQITGVLPHIGGAMVVAVLTLVVSVVVLQHFPQHRDLKSPATTLITLVLIQTLLGITVFVMLLLNTAATSVFVWISTGHVSVGALVLAASVVMHIRIGRNIGLANSAR